METTLQHICFISLFMNMLYYWFFLGFSFLRKYYSFFSKVSVICLISLSLLISLRWYSSGHFPLSNLYESLIFLAWTIQLVLIGLEKKSNNSIIGILLSPTVLFIEAFAFLGLPSKMQLGTSLVPSLQSNWLMMHVSIMILSYGSLFVGCILSICYLTMSFYNAQIKTTNNFNSTLLLFDDLSYRTIGLGFPLLTLGILSGAIWANETWGSYWSWDPKETWALITWFVFAIYLHTRLVKGWEGKESAKIASVGFIVLWVCYLGVNLLGKGLHSYGWWS